MNILSVWAVAALLSTPGDPPVIEDRVPARLAVLDPAAPAQEDAWRVDMAIYFWMADLEGDFTVGGVTAEADADFSEVFDHLKMALTLHSEIWRKNRVGLLIDLNWLDVEDEGEIGPLETTVSVTMGMSEVAAAFRMKEDIVFVDLLGGVRWILLETEPEINGVARESEEHSYVDPIFGVRFGVEAAEWLLFTFRVDVGGFGIGTDQEASMTLISAFRITRAIAAVIGYRAFALEIVDDNSSVEFRMKGPLLAIDVGF